MKKNRVITGVQPTGEIHLGNYFGSIKQIVDLEKYDEIFVFVADLHALTTSGMVDQKHDRNVFEKMCNDLISSFIALGINPNKVVIYRQSEFPQITELMWIFSSLLKFQFLSSAHAYKDAIGKNKDLSLSAFLYPILMASDIVLPDSNIVPVGKDQLQHIEITREIIRKFNNIAGSDILQEPKEKIIESVQIIPGTDGEKMSKSKNNIIPIFSNEIEIKKSIANIITDSTPKGKPISTDQTIMKLLKLLIDKKEFADIENRCVNGTTDYKELKEILLKSHLKYFSKQRKIYAKISKNKNYINSVLNKNRKYLNKIFDERLNNIKKCIGLKETKRGGLFS